MYWNFNLLRLKQIRWDLVLNDHKIGKVCSDREVDNIKDHQLAIKSDSFYATVGTMIQQKIKGLEFDVDVEYQGLTYNVKADATIDVNHCDASWDYPGHHDVEVRWEDTHIVIQTDEEGDEGPELSHFDDRYDTILELAEEPVIKQKEFYDE